MVLLTFGIALVLSLLLVPIVRQAGRRLGYVAKPRKDRWHSQPTPILGGVGIFTAFLLSLLVTLLLGGAWGQVRWGVLAGSGLIFLFGLYDDIKHISPPAKLAGQILAAAVVVSQGYTSNFFTPRIPNQIIAQIPNILLTFIWLVGITNAINLLDNMDGLAGGIALITAGILSIFFWNNGNQGLLAISMALAGSVLGFLFFNFPPASIFMGDSGSQFLGFTLAVLAIARQPQASNVIAVVGVPTLLFLLPILDTTLVTFTRLLRGQSPAQGGRDHTSHRLIAFGLSERQAVLFLYAVALIAGVMAAMLEAVQYWFSLVLMPILVIVLALLTAYLGGLKVLTGSFPQKSNRTITRIMLELTFKRRLLEVALDFFLIGVAYYLSYLTYFGFSMDADGLELFLRSFPIVLAGTYVSFFAFGVYRGVWRYIGVGDLLRFLEAVLGSAVLVAGAVFLLYPSQPYSLKLFIFYAIFLFMGLAASRSSFRILDLLSGRQTRQAEQRVLICGAGDAGEMALRWIMMNPQMDYRPVGFLDDDPFLAGRQIHGVEVLGKLETLETLLENKQIDGVILTLSILDNHELVDRVMTVCRQRGSWVRSLRLEFELVE
jgi:UDP-GlcNAc:undecaprenyl-phosphate/decaprenyl-phosphate GlcNAc-1-phosphate transferase